MQQNLWKYFLPCTLMLAVVVTLQLSIIRPATAYADSGRYDYIQLISTGFLYNGSQGILLLDKRNGNVWFLSKGSDTKPGFKDPAFVVRVPLEKLDEQAR